MSHATITSQDVLLAVEKMLGEFIHRLQNPPPVDERQAEIWADRLIESVSLIDDDGIPFVIKAKLETEAGEVIHIDETLPFATNFKAWDYLYLLAEMQDADITRASIVPAGTEQ